MAMEPRPRLGREYDPSRWRKCLSCWYMPWSGAKIAHSM